jgi:hypothetical protein
MIGEMMPFYLRVGRACRQHYGHASRCGPPACLERACPPR